ncbi:MAG: Minf_1886 family protein [Limisphaerales bacterium]
MQSVHFDEVIDKIVAQDSRYHRDAYSFLREALEFTQKNICKKGEVRHVTGAELLEGLRDYALTQFGPMAITVLDEWGIRSTEDFGEMVFNMVEHNLLAKTEEDSRADFKEGYNFNETFCKPFRPGGGKASSDLKPVS